MWINCLDPVTKNDPFLVIEDKFNKEVWGFYIHNGTVYSKLGDKWEKWSDDGLNDLMTDHLNRGSGHVKVSSHLDD